MGLTTVVLIFGALLAAVQSSTVLDGYLRRSSDNYCFKNNGGTPDMVEVTNNVPTDCTKVKVIGSAAAGYFIADATETSDKFTIATETHATPLTLTTGATALKFVDTSSNDVCGAGLGSSGSPFIIDIKTGAQTGSDCLKNDLTYANTDDPATCNNMLFYFETIDCSSFTDCSLCFDAGGLRCSSCGNSKKPDPSLTGCEACTGNTIVDECGMVCTACEVAGVPNADHTACEACPEGQAQDDAGETCIDCTSPQVANEAGTECVDCDVAMDDCNTCSSYQTCTACKNNKVLNQTGTACEDLEGYLVFQDAAKCFTMDGSNPSTVAPDSIPDDCTKVKLSSHDTAGYVLAVASDTTKQFTYAADTDGTALTLTDTGTAFQFVAGGNPVITATDLVNADVPVLVVRNDGETGGQDCMLEDLMYKNTDVTTSCDNKGWYFVLDCSSVTDCGTCTLDEMTKISCTTCSSPKITKDGQCQDCGTAITDCTTCVSASNTCSACGNNKVPDDNGATCVSCPDSQERKSDGTGCEDSTDSGNNVILPMSLGAVLLMAAMGKIILA